MQMDHLDYLGIDKFGIHWHSPEIVFRHVNIVLPVGVIIEAEYFHCEDSYIEAAYINLPSKDSVYMDNCTLKGDVYFKSQPYSEFGPCSWSGFDQVQEYKDVINIPPIHHICHEYESPVCF